MSCLFMNNAGLDGARFLAAAHYIGYFISWFEYKGVSFGILIFLFYVYLIILAAQTTEFMKKV